MLLWPVGPTRQTNALGGGGIPRARVSEIFGPEGSGKTTVSTGLAYVQINWTPHPSRTATAA